MYLLNKLNTINNLTLQQTIKYIYYNTLFTGSVYTHSPLQIIWLRLVIKQFSVRRICQALLPANSYSLVKSINWKYPSITITEIICIVNIIKLIIIIHLINKHTPLLVYNRRESSTLLSITLSYSTIFLDWAIYYLRFLVLQRTESHYQWVDILRTKL